MGHHRWAKFWRVTAAHPPKVSFQWNNTHTLKVSRSWIRWEMRPEGEPPFTMAAPLSMRGSVLKSRGIWGKTFSDHSSSSLTVLPNTNHPLIFKTHFWLTPGYFFKWHEWQKRRIFFLFKYSAFSKLSCLNQTFYGKDPNPKCDVGRFLLIIKQQTRLEESLIKNYQWLLIALAEVDQQKEKYDQRSAWSVVLLLIKYFQLTAPALVSELLFTNTVFTQHEDVAPYNFIKHRKLSQ